MTKLLSLRCVLTPNAPYNRETTVVVNYTQPENRIYKSTRTSRKRHPMPKTCCKSLHVLMIDPSICDVFPFESGSVDLCRALIEMKFLERLYGGSLLNFAESRKGAEA